MAIPNFIGNVVRLLWCDIPYVGYFLGIDKDQNVILTDCLMYTNFLMCFYKTINYTAQQINYVRLPLCNIIWIGYLRITEDQTKKELDGIESFNLTKLFHVPHCQVCFKPGERILIQQEESGAAYTLIGNTDCDPRQPKIVPDYVSLLAGKKCALCENGGNAAIKAEPSPRPRPQPDYAYNLYNQKFYKTLENLPRQNNDGIEPSPDPKNNSAYTASIIPILIEFLVNDSTGNSSQYVNDSLLRLLTEIASYNCNPATDDKLDLTKKYANNTANMESIDNVADVINGNQNIGFENMEGIENVGSFENIESAANSGNFRNLKNVENKNNFRSIDNFENLGRSEVIGNSGYSGNIRTTGYAENFENKDNFQRFGNMKDDTRFGTLSHFKNFENVVNVNNFENVRNEGVGNDQNYRSMISTGNIMTVNNFDYTKRTNGSEISTRNIDGNRGIDIHNHNMRTSGDSVTMHNLENFRDGINGGNFVNLKNVKIFGSDGSYKNKSCIRMCSQNMQPSGSLETKYNFGNAGNVGNFNNTDNVGRMENHGGYDYIRSTCNLKSVENSLYAIGANKSDISIGSRDMNVNRSIGICSQNMQPIGRFETMNNFENSRNAGNVSNLGITENVGSIENERNYGSIGSTGKLMGVENFLYRIKTNLNQISVKNKNVKNGSRFYSHFMQPFQGFKTPNNCGNARNVVNFENTKNVKSFVNKKKYRNTIINRARNSGHIIKTNKSEIGIKNIDVNTSTGLYNHNMQPIRGFETINRFENLENAGNIGIFSNTENVQSFGNEENYGCMRSTDNIESVEIFGHTRTNESEINIESMNVNRSIGLYSQNMQPIRDFETVNSLQILRSAGNFGNFGNKENVQSCGNEDNYGTMGSTRSTDNIRSGISIGNMDVNRGTGIYSLNVQPIGGFETVNRFENLEIAGNIGFFSNTENEQSLGNVENYGNMRSTGNIESVGNFGYTRRTNESEISIENMNVNRSIGLYSQNMQPIGDFETMNSFQNWRSVANVGNFSNTENAQSVGNEDNYGTMGYTKNTDNIRSGISIGNMDVNRGTGIYSLNVQPIGGFKTMDRFENLENAGNIGIFSNTESVQTFENVENYGSRRSTGNIDSVENFGYTRRTNESEVNIKNMNVNRRVGPYSQIMQPIGDFETMQSFQNLRSAGNAGNFGNTKNVQSCGNEDNYGSIGYIRSTDSIRSGISIENIDFSRGTGFYSLNVQPIGDFETINRFENLENTGNIFILSNTENVQSFGNVENYESMRSTGNIESVGNFGYTRRTNESEINIENMNVNRSIGFYSQNVQPIGDFKTMNSFQNLRCPGNIGIFCNTENVQSFGNVENYGNMRSTGNIESVGNFGYTRRTNESEISIENINVNRSIGLYSQNMQPIGDFDTMISFQNLRSPGNVGNFGNTENVQSCGNEDNYGSMRYIRSTDNIRSGISFENIDVNRGTGLYSLNLQPIELQIENLENTGNIGIFSNTENEQSFGNVENYGSMRSTGNIESVGNFGYTRRTNESEINIENVNVNRSIGLYSQNMQPIGDFETMNSFQNLRSPGNVGNFGNTENVQSCGNEDSYGNMRYIRSTDNISGFSIGNMDVNRGTGLYVLNVQPFGGFESMNNFGNFVNARDDGNSVNTENVKSLQNKEN